MGQYLKMNLDVPEQYIEGFIRANNTFLYQLVFDPVRRKVVPLNPYPEHIDPAALPYAGLYPPLPLTCLQSVSNVEAVLILLITFIQKPSSKTITLPLNSKRTFIKMF